MGEWVFCDYDELEIDYLKDKKYVVKKLPNTPDYEMGNQKVLSFLIIYL